MYNHSHRSFVTLKTTDAFFRLFIPAVYNKKKYNQDAVNKQQSITEVTGFGWTIAIKGKAFPLQA